MINNERDVIFTLSLNGIPGVGSITYRKLIERFGCAENVFKAGRKNLDEIPRIQKTTIDAILSAQPEERGKREFEEAAKRGFRLLIFGSDDYPTLLSQIPDPPPVIYASGELLKTDELAVAIVGSRDPSEYGKRFANNLARDLARAGVTVVSGMARGVDSAAHRGVIEAGGRTIAVLGSGLDIVYPPENIRLFEEIVNSGAAISPFSIGTRPDRGNFPARNRIISGMSLGVVVVQATKPDSGSLITARLALEQGREVFAVPGEAGTNIGRATNDLIKRGQAKLVDNFKDILEEILPQFDTGKIKPTMLETPLHAAPPPNLVGDERAVWGKLSNTPIHIDNLARECTLPIHRVSATLLQLELKGLIEQQPGKLFLRK